MNIDLLMTNDGDAGLVCDDSFDAAAAGVMFDAQAHALTLEFTNLDYFDLNIPVEEQFVEGLFYSFTIQVGVIKDGEIVENRQVPLLLLNDPAAKPGQSAAIKPRNSVLAFERFLKSCVAGQPVHRADLGDESSAGAIMGGMNAGVLKFAPHLARQRAFEIAPRLAPSGAPQIGLGGGPGHQTRQQTIRRRTRTDSDDSV